MGCRILSIQLVLIIFSLDFYPVTYGQPPTAPNEPQKYFKFQSSPAILLHKSFIASAIDSVLKLGLCFDCSEKRMRFHSPKDLKKKFDFCLKEDGISNSEVLVIIDHLFQISPHPAHRFRVGRRVAGLDPLAVIGDWMASTMSNLVVTYMVAPIWTMMEIKMTEYLSKQIGWTKTGDMVPTSGCGAANSMAMAVATHWVAPETRDIGHFHIEGRLLIYVSKHASISWKSAAFYNGIGTDNIVEVDVTDQGRMDLNSLRVNLKAASAKDLKVMVVATAGTPILGFIDPIEEIGQICEEFDVWFHVDAEKAGSYLFTDNVPQKLSGIARANSVTVGMWMFAAPYTSSMLLTKDPDALQQTFGLHASYVFTGIDHYNGSYDRGDHTIQTSRRPEIAKIWFAAARGEQETTLMFAEMDRRKILFLNDMGTRDGFSEVDTRRQWYNLETTLATVSFYFTPMELRGRAGPAYVQAMTNTAKRVIKVLKAEGLIDLSLGFYPHRPAYFGFYVISFTNLRFTQDDFPFVFDTIAKVAEGGKIDRNFKFPAVPTPEKTNLTYPNFLIESVYSDILRSTLLEAASNGTFFFRTNRVFNMKQPTELELAFEFALPHAPTNDMLNKLHLAFESIIEFSPHWDHPYWIYQLAAGLDPYTLIADYISPILNTPMLNYHDSAPFMLMEEELVKQLGKRVYKKCEVDGIITDGGSMANQIAIAMARFDKYKLDHTKEGMKVTRGRKFIIFTSGDAHYSTKKGAIFQGIGLNNTIEVESNNIGQMRVDKLEEEIIKAKTAGDIPLMVVITTGTTMYGAIDPIDAIVDLCQKHFIWTHVDGMFGGLVAMSDKHIGIFKGIERTDSWGADLHKLMGSTMVCTILLTRWPSHLRQAFSLGLPKIEQEDPYEDDLNLNLMGTHSQMDKRNNVLKFWLLWKAKGRKGLEAHVDKIMSNKDYLISKIKQRKSDGFELIIDNYDLTNVCFIYIPPDLNPEHTPGVDRNSAEWKQEMNKVAFQIEKAFVKNGVMSFVTQHRREADGTNTVNFIKFVMMGSALTEDDIDFFLDSVHYYGRQLEASGRAEITDNFIKEHRTQFDPFGTLPKYVDLGHWGKKFNKKSWQ